MSSSPLPTTSGVYAIYSACNDRWYFGSAKNLRKRKGDHWSKLNRDDPDDPHGNDHLQRAWNKYGPEAFEFCIIEECPIDQLLIREQVYLDLNFYLDPNPYNICRTAGSRLGATNSPEHNAKISVAMTGRKLSDETRARMSEAKKAWAATPEGKEQLRVARLEREFSDETRARMSEAKMGNTNCVGNVLSDEHKANISATMTGRKLTPEHIANISESLIGNTRTLGYRHTEESKAKMSESRMGNTNTLGYKHTDEAKANMSASRTGRKATDEHRANISASLKGRKASPEARANMLAAQKARRERERAEKSSVNDA